MTGFQAARVMQADGNRRSIFDRVGAFLADHGLSPDPAHYAFAYQVITEPGGQLARAVAAITDGGVRLSRTDIETLGGTVRHGPAPAINHGDDFDEQAVLVARARDQVDGMATIIESVEAEARGFGRDLAASAEAIREAGASPAAAIDEIARLTGAMLQRVHESERRLADSTAEARALRIQLDEARGEARSDPLTGLSNRLGLEERFADRDAALQSCFAICDIDHFKLVNDRFGHNAGDRVLRAIARTLAENCEGHFVARLGGEEFAVLFQGADIDTAARILDAARETIANKRFRLRETDAPVGVVTLSAGLAALAPGLSLVDACARADGALYAAKANGRDRLEIAPVGGEIY